MKISKRGEYALEAMVELAVNYEKGVESTLIHDIARKERIPPRYLEHILLNLKNSGFLQSKRGAGGGYSLAKSPGEITLGTLIQTLEGPIFLMEKTRRSAVYPVSEISSGLRSVMKEMAKSVLAVLDGITLKDMAAKAVEAVEAKKTNLNYAI